MGSPKPRSFKARKKRQMIEMRKKRWAHRSPEKGEREERPVSQYIGDHTLQNDIWFWVHPHWTKCETLMFLNRFIINGPFSHRLWETVLTGDNVL